MKVENTPEAKARFFDLYRRLKVGHWGDIPNDGQFYILESHYSHSDFCLLLTPLSQISDEDAIEVAKIIEPYVGFSDMWTPAMGRRWAVEIQKGSAIPNARSAVDFLRSRGYYVGDGAEIEYGWCRMKGEKP